MTDQLDRVRVLRRAARRDGQTFHVARIHNTTTQNYYVTNDQNVIEASWDTLDAAEEAFRQ